MESSVEGPDFQHFSNSGTEVTPNSHCQTLPPLEDIEPVNYSGIVPSSFSE